MHPYPIIPGSQVTHEGEPYIVRKLDDVEPDCLHLDHVTGGFYRLVHVSTVTLCFLASDDDLCIWPDGTWCHRHELPDFSHLSDDYRVVSVFTPAYDVEHEVLTCSSPAAQTVNDLPVPLTGQEGATLADFLKWLNGYYLWLDESSGNFLSPVVSARMAAQRRAIELMPQFVRLFNGAAVGVVKA